MSSGENAAEQTKGFFKNLSNATEGVRQNVNSFADNLINKDASATGTTAGTNPVGGHKTNHTQDATGSGILGSGDVHTGPQNTTGTTTGGAGSGVHPHAQAAADGIGKVFSKKE